MINATMLNLIERIRSINPENQVEEKIKAEYLSESYMEEIAHDVTYIMDEEGTMKHVIETPESFLYTPHIDIMEAREDGGYEDCGFTQVDIDKFIFKYFREYYDLPSSNHPEDYDWKSEWPDESFDYLKS